MWKKQRQSNRCLQYSTQLGLHTTCCCIGYYCTISGEHLDVVKGSTAERTARQRAKCDAQNHFTHEISAPSATCVRFHHSVHTRRVRPSLSLVSSLSTFHVRPVLLILFYGITAKSLRNGFSLVRLETPTQSATCCLIPAHSWPLFICTCHTSHPEIIT